MKYLHKISLVLLTCAAALTLGACAGSNPTFRNYYLDGNCKTFYVDAFGNRVMEGNVRGHSLVGLPLHQDAMGRWFYQDSLGDRTYLVRHCR